MTAATVAISDRPRLTLAETAADSSVMAARQLRKVLRRPMYVGYLFIQPVLFVLLFRYVFGGAINTGHVSYVDYLLPGIIVMTAIFGALATGLGLTEDLAAGVVDRLRSLPIARSAVLIGRTAADMVTNFVTLIVMLVIGVAVGFRPSQPFYEVVLAFALVLAFAYVFSWISAFVGLSVKNPEAAQSIGFIWVFPLVFASSAFVPTAHMPDVVRAFADVNPVSLAVNVMGVELGGGVEQQPAPLVRLRARRLAGIDEEVGQELDLQVLEARVVEDLLHLAQAAGLELVLDVGVPQADALEADPRRLGAPVAPLERAPLAPDVDLRGTAHGPVQGQQIDLAHRRSSFAPRDREADASAGCGSFPACPRMSSCRFVRQREGRAVARGHDSV